MRTPEYEIGKITVGQLVDLMAEKLGERDALVYHSTGLRLTHQQFKEKCDQIAKGFIALGLKKGSHVAIWASNVAEWVLTQFGSAKMGGVLVTVNTQYRSFELEYLLKQSDSSTLVLVDGVHQPRDYFNMVYGLCPELKTCQPGQLKSEKFPYLKNVIAIGEERMPGMFRYDDLYELSSQISDEEYQKRQEEVIPDDVVNMQYTSGTTGFPKGVMLTHTNVIGNAKSQADCLNFTPEDKLCITVPFFHCFGCVMGTMLCVSSGATMVPVESFRARRVLEAIQDVRCTAVHGVPTMFITELEEMKKTKFDLSSLRTGIMAGSPCPTEVMKAVVEKMGMKEICITYGLTEASPGITMTRTSDPLELRVSTVGRLLPGVEVKLIDPNTGEKVGINQPGELCTRGYHVMKGYYNMPEETQKVIEPNGWLHSGDIATVDENGYYRITGRLKDMIIRGGENIYPREIEEYLYLHSKIKDVQVIGVPSRYYGEEVVAFVQLKPDEEMTEIEAKDFCWGRISRYKIPSYFFFIESFPTTASGKIQKFKLREQAVKLLGLESEGDVKFLTRKSTNLEPDGRDLPKIQGFMEKEVLPIGVDGEVLNRATKALTEYYQRTTEAKLAQGIIETMAIIDTNSIDISIRYEGETLPFPFEEPKSEEESNVEKYNLSRSGYYIRQLTDRLRWEQRAGSSRIHFYFFLRPQTNG
jgi:fatty-acyl-CoA synthase